MGEGCGKELFRLEKFENTVEYLECEGTEGEINGAMVFLATDALIVKGYMIVIPKLMTTKGQKQLYKVADLVIEVPVWHDFLVPEKKIH